MFNKNNQKASRPCSRGVANGSMKAKSKLTVFMVYKMIEKRKEMERESKNCPIIYDHHFVSQEMFTRDSYPNPSLSNKKQRQFIKCQTQQEQLIKSATYRKKARCQTQLETSSIEPVFLRKQNNIMTTKNIVIEQTSEINRLIIEKLKKVICKNERQKKKDKFIKLEDFGLNITQIKRLEIPLKKDTLKQNSNLSKPFRMTQSENKNEGFSKISKNNGRSILAKRSLIKQKPSVKEIFVDDKQYIKSTKFQSLDQSNMNRNVSGKKIGKEMNNYAYKLHKMFDCLDLILNSYHCTFNRQQVKGGQQLISLSENQSKIKKNLNNKYYFYIGNGNNSNLIRSILRKRSWWTETSSLQKANLVWTQLKIPQVIERLDRHQDNWQDNFLPYQEEIDIRQSHLRSSCKKSSTTDHSESPKARNIFQIFHEKQDKRYHSILNPKEAEQRLEKVETPQLMHNHYQQNYMFGNKNALYYNISNYYEFISKDISTIVPLTYYLEKTNSKSWLDFQKVYAEFKKKGMVWIVKPAQNSNRGQGIIVTTSLNDIKTSINIHKKIMVQSYIKNLLLYNGRKFDIRVYMLALTIHGRLKVFWYDQGYIRTSSQPYDLTNLLDSYVHLTNDAIQKSGDNYSKYEQGNKLSYSEFQRYLENKYPKQNIHISDLHQQMKELARDAVKSIYSRINNGNKEFSFELFGLDFIIDSNFKPLLIEINTNPCLQLASPVLERLIPRMVENVFRLSVDPIFRPKIEYSFSKSQSYYIYDQSFLQRNKFTVIFDQKYDRNFEWEELCKKMRGIEWGYGEEEIYQNEGNLIVVDY